MEYGMHLLISQFRGVLHKPRIGIIPVRRKLAPGHNWSAVASITWRPADVCRCAYDLYVNVGAL